MKKATMGIAATLAILLVLAVAFSLNITGGMIGAMASSVEVYNGIDDDGDTYIDEYDDPGGYPRYLEESCNGIGECGTGMVWYFSPNDVIDCTTNPGRDEYDGSPESCDSLDNDCDGDFDEDFDYNGIHVGNSCDGIGECGTGVVYCVNITTSDCSTNPGRLEYDGSPESCNGLDDDCDNTTDEDPDMCTQLDDQCNLGVCVSGACEAQPANEGNPCDDNAWCNVGETCQSGFCTGGSARDCSDGVDCTDDSCNEGMDSCNNTPDNNYCDNTFWCDGDEWCDAVLDCQAGTAQNCSDSVGCTDDSCNEGTDSCDNVPNDSLCDNGQWCDGSETCNAVLDCQPGIPIDCYGNNIPGIAKCDNIPDSNPWTWDFRNPFTSNCVEDGGNTGHCTTGDTTITYTCNVTECGAECDAITPCADTDCDPLDDCYDSGKTYRDYNDVENTCQGDCSCTDNPCTIYAETGTDSDGDGWDVECGDCNDNNNTTYPGAPELCNGIDDNCNNETDEGFDNDGDGIASCFDNCPDDYNPDQNDTDGDTIGDACDPCMDVDEDTFCLEIDDCNDNNDTIYPGATEYCDGVDSDCDAVLDGSELLFGPDCGEENCSGQQMCTDAGEWGNCTSQNDPCGILHCEEMDTTCADYRVLFTCNWNGTCIDEEYGLTCEENATAIYDDGTSICDISDIYECQPDEFTLGADLYDKTVYTYCGVYTGLCNGAVDNSDPWNLCQECGYLYYCSAEPPECYFGGEITLSQSWNLFSPIIEPTDDNTNRSIQLRMGWNMFGYSSTKPFNWSEALVSNGTDTKTIEGAASENWLQFTIYYYEDGNYKFIPGNDEYLRQNKGYWVYAFEDDLTLTFEGVGGSLQDNYSFYWLDANVTNGTDTKTIEEANSSNWLQLTIYYFDENNQYYQFVPRNDEYIYPWRGYWLYNNEATELMIE